MHALRDPRYNLREIAKQCVLIEHHLSDQGRRCPECIGKHLLTWEALAEEIVQLAPGTGYAREGQRLADIAREFGSRAEIDPTELAGVCRQVRKYLIDDSKRVILRPSRQRSLYGR